MINKREQKQLRHKRIRKQIFSKDVPRLVVFRSNKHIYAQLIDDKSAKTLASASDKLKKAVKTNKIESAHAAGIAIAEKAAKAKIKNVVFDRAGYKFHGRIKSLADGARKGGLVF